MNERFVSLNFQVGSKSPTMILACVPNSSAHYPFYLESMKWVLDGALTRDHIVLRFFQSTIEL